MNDLQQLESCMPKSAYEEIPRTNRAVWVFNRLIRQMGLANNARFMPDLAQYVYGVSAIEAMMQAGVKFTAEEVDLLVNGEASKREYAFADVVEPFAMLDHVLNRIFDGYTHPGVES